MATRELHLVSHVTTILDLSSFNLERRVLFFFLKVLLAGTSHYFESCD